MVVGSEDFVPFNGDLTEKISPYLDAHLTLTILHGLRDKKVYPEEEIEEEMRELLNGHTNLIGLLQELNPEDDFGDRVRQVGDKIDTLQKRIAPILQLIEDPARNSEFQNCANLQQIQEKYEVTTHMLEEFYEWCSENYQCGIYNKAILGLNMYNQILAKVREPESFGGQGSEWTPLFVFERNLTVKWGMLASFIADRKWEYAADVAMKLDELLDATQTLGKEQILFQRTWLLHWMLFILLKTPASMQEHPQIQKTLDLFLSEKMLALVSLQCPHILRYTAACFLIHKRKHMTKDLVHVLLQDRHAYRDSLTEFLLALHQDMNFEASKKHFFDFQEMCKQDFFLWDNVEQLSTNARFSIFSIYCRIHQSVDIYSVAEKMGMPVEKTESWIVELIQSGKLKATIDNSDSEGGLRVFFPKTETDVYSQVISKTKNMSFRLFMLASNANTILKKDGFNPHTLSPQIAQHLLN